MRSETPRRALTSKALETLGATGRRPPQTLLLRVHLTGARGRLKQRRCRHRRARTDTGIVTTPPRDATTTKRYGRPCGRASCRRGAPSVVIQACRRRRQVEHPATTQCHAGPCSRVQALASSSVLSRTVADRLHTRRRDGGHVTASNEGAQWCRRPSHSVRITRRTQVIICPSTRVGGGVLCLQLRELACSAQRRRDERGHAAAQAAPHGIAPHTASTSPRRRTPHCNGLGVRLRAAARARRQRQLLDVRVFRREVHAAHEMRDVGTLPIHTATARYGDNRGDSGSAHAQGFGTVQLRSVASARTSRRSTSPGSRHDRRPLTCSFARRLRVFSTHVRVRSRYSSAMTSRDTFLVVRFGMRAASSSSSPRPIPPS